MEANTKGQRRSPASEQKLTNTVAPGIEEEIYQRKRTFSEFLIWDEEENISIIKGERKIMGLSQSFDHNYCST
jgi:hypothetical protein